MFFQKTRRKYSGRGNLLQLPKVSHDVPKPADNLHTTIRYLAPHPAHLRPELGQNNLTSHDAAYPQHEPS